MAKQQQIPGTERKTIKEIDDAAEAYVEARDKRMRLTEKEVERREALVNAMKRNGLTIYRDDSASPALLVMLKPGKDVVKVTTADGVDGGAEEVEP